jgi:hypothetical protein
VSNQPAAVDTAALDFVSRLPPAVLRRKHTLGALWGPSTINNQQSALINRHS